MGKQTDQPDWREREVPSSPPPTTDPESEVRLSSSRTHQSGRGPHAWAPSKKGGLYRHGRWPGERFAIATVKQAKSGSWYGTRDGEMIDGWFDSAHEAMDSIDRSCCVLK